jgi:hypothetical protein
MNIILIPKSESKYAELENLRCILVGGFLQAILDSIEVQDDSCNVTFKHPTISMRECRGGSLDTLAGLLLPKPQVNVKVNAVIASLLNQFNVLIFNKDDKGVDYTHLALGSADKVNLTIDYDSYTYQCIATTGRHRQQVHKNSNIKRMEVFASLITLGNYQTIIKIIRKFKDAKSTSYKKHKDPIIKEW